MRRMLTAIAVAAAVLFGSNVAASAAPAANLNREVSGAYSGPQHFDFGGSGCSFVHQVFEGSYQVHHRSGTFHIEACVTTTSSALFAEDGTFTLTTPHGAVLSGAAHGTTDAVTPLASLDLTLTVEHGTKNFTHAHGTIALTGTWSGFETGTTNGTLTGHLHH